MEGRDETWSTREADLANQAAVLRALLEAHPVLLTRAELVLELAGERSAFAERDAVERAVRDLGATGLAHTEGGLVLPSRAALHFSELMDR